MFISKHNKRPPDPRIGNSTEEDWSLWYENTTTNERGRVREWIAKWAIEGLPWVHGVLVSTPRGKWDRAGIDIEIITCWQEKKRNAVSIPLQIKSRDDHRLDFIERGIETPRFSVIPAVVINEKETNQEIARKIEREIALWLARFDPYNRGSGKRRRNLPKELTSYFGRILI